VQIGSLLPMCRLLSQFSLLVCGSAQAIGPGEIVL
jgi:hypothetical protein